MICADMIQLKFNGFLLDFAGVIDEERANVINHLRLLRTQGLVHLVYRVAFFAELLNLGEDIFEGRHSFFQCLNTEVR